MRHFTGGPPPSSSAMGSKGTEQTLFANEKRRQRGDTKRSPIRSRHAFWK